MAAAGSRHGERNALLIALLFDGCLRVSEAQGLRPVDLVRSSWIPEDPENVVTTRLTFRIYLPSWILDKN